MSLRSMRTLGSNPRFFFEEIKTPLRAFFTSWRKREDSNLRYIAVYTRSRRAPSTTRTRFRLDRL